MIRKPFPSGVRNPVLFEESLRHVDTFALRSMLSAVSARRAPPADRRRRAQIEAELSRRAQGDALALISLLH